MSKAQKSKRPTRYFTKARKTRAVSEAMTEIGRLGGKARAEKLTPDQRRKIAIRASDAAAAARSRKAQDRRAAATNVSLEKAAVYVGTAAPEVPPQKQNLTPIAKPQSPIAAFPRAAPQPVMVRRADSALIRRRQQEIDAQEQLRRARVRRRWLESLKPRNVY
jgi:hypothetical protein